MIYVGIDDTDTLDDPGTNQLARHVVRELAGRYRARMNIRHQLLEDSRVPCTSKNGCVSLQLEPIGDAEPISQLIDCLRRLICGWCPDGSDPGLCVAGHVPSSVVEWGHRCKQELVTQSEARKIAAESGIHLEGLGGTEDGVIGALAAVGLAATKNDGRIVYFGDAAQDWYDVTGCFAVDDLHARGIDEIRTIDSSELLSAGMIYVGKRLRPNYRGGKIVLYVAHCDEPHWEAVRVL